MTILVSIPEYARRVGLNPSTIHRQVSSGALPSVEGKGGRRLIDVAMADLARAKNSNIRNGHGGKADRTMRRQAVWKAKRADGYDPAVKACLFVMREAWPELTRKAMAILGADELNQARAVLAVQELVAVLACAVHEDINKDHVYDFRVPLPALPDMAWSSPEVAEFFRKCGGAPSDDESLWTSDDADEGLPGGTEWADEACEGCGPARASLA